MDCPQLSKTLFALVRSSGLRRTGSTLVPNLAAPPGVQQICSVSWGKSMSNEPGPQMSSKSFRYSDWASLNAMQAVSGLAISRGSTGGCWACSASALCSKYPVERPSQKFPPKNAPCVSLYSRTGNLGEYVYRCAVRLPALKRNDPGYATVVRLTDGIGPLKPAYGMWQEAQATFRKGEMFSSKFISFPRVRTAAYPLP